MTNLFINDCYFNTLDQLKEYLASATIESGSMQATQIYDAVYGQDLRQWVVERHPDQTELIAALERLDSGPILPVSEVLQRVIALITAQAEVHISKPDFVQHAKLVRTETIINDTGEMYSLVKLFFQIIQPINECYLVELKAEDSKQVLAAQSFSLDVLKDIFELCIEFSNVPIVNNTHIAIDGQLLTLQNQNGHGRIEYAVLPNHSPNKGVKANTEFLYLIRKDGCRAFQVLNKDGNKIEGIDTILIADLLFNVISQSDCPPYILGLNTADDNLYFISPKQILNLGNWENGRLDSYHNSSWNRYNPSELKKYDDRSYRYAQEVIIKDFSSFSIKDKYDYETYYRVEEGICTKTTTPHSSNPLPYVNSVDDVIFVSTSTQTGEKVIIPGFKANIYLGNDDGTDIFWAVRKCSAGQYRFNEAYIVDIKGNIIRNYEYHVAWPLLGKYILNIFNCKPRSISTIRGEEIIKCNANWSDVDLSNIEEIEPDIFKFNRFYSYSSEGLFWLVKENVFCHKYNKDFYFTRNSNYDESIYSRANNQLIGIIQPSEYYEFIDHIYGANFLKKNVYDYCFFNSIGETIYTLKDNEMAHLIEIGDGKWQGGGVSENRIIINVDSRYYKILDYNAQEIARIDFTGIADCYHCGKLYYFNDTELGYYDINGVKHLINYETRKKIQSVRVLASNFLLIKHNNKEVIIDLNGEVLIEGQCITPDVDSTRYIEVVDEHHNHLIYDNECKKLFSTELSDRLLILE